MASVVATLIVLLGCAGAALAGRPDELPEGTITEVKFAGNISITEGELRGKIKSRAGRPLDRLTIENDYKALLATKWFSDARPVYERDDARKGYILIFEVVEMPILRDVQFIGRTKVKLKDIEESTTLKKGNRADSVKARLAVNQIQTLYEEKGFEKAEVRLLEGGNPGDTRVIMEIFEGPKFTVDGIEFIGNTFVDDAVLATKIETRKGFFPGLSLGARRHKDGVQADTRALIKYYQDNGFFDVKISPTTKPGVSLGQERITFTISEGVQYKVRKIVFEGNQKLPEAQLREGLMLKAGDPYNEAIRDLDYKKIMTHYWAIGCWKTSIQKETPPTAEPGMLDVVYRIEEGNPFLLGQFIVRGNARTKEKVVRREALMAGLLPGEVLDLNRVETFKKRLGGTGYFAGSAAGGPGASQGKPIEVRIENERPGNLPFGDAKFADFLGPEQARMQSPEPELQLPGDPPPLPPLEVPPAQDPMAGQGAAPPPAQGSPTTPAGPEGVMPFGGVDRFAPPVNTVPPTLDPPPLPPPPGSTRPGTGGNQGALPGDGFPNLPNNNMNNVGPGLGEAFPNRSYADIVTNVDEAPTGRLMFGLGASSYSGLSGNIIFHESNFDLFAIPRSWAELTSGRAFRGAGQEFRIDLMPGTLVNRYTVSFRDPYLFDLPLNFSVQGYQWSRYYTDWSERRSGGKVALGYQFGTQTYADIAARVEDVDLHGFKYPAPASLLAAAGHTTLVTVRPSIRFDNRNNPMAPSSGSYLEAAFEEGLGTFTFPKFTLEAKQHFTTGSRPDGSGKRILTFRSFFGITGRDTPIYERFFAGDFRSMRGFYYRGVGPHVLGVNTGGVMESIGSIEYQFPWTASDTLQQVFFCDFGTVEANYSFTTFRAAIGTGFRVVIPQITGQLPLAFDLSFPVAKAEGDRVRYFTFFIGAFW